MAKDGVRDIGRWRRGLAFALLLCWAWPASATDWPRNDVPSDPALRQDVLPNGMRYVIMSNHAPAGAVSVRLSIGVGAVHEAADQRGFAHFVEHMAFRGSENYPDGEIKRSLERLGLRFGADVNATTGQYQTIYRFDLPGADAKNTGEALAILRDIAGNLNFDPPAVETEAGVVISESALRGTPSFQSLVREWEFQLQDPRASAMAGSVSDIVQRPQAEQLQRFYRAFYRPERAVLTVVGDVDAGQVAAEIALRFSDWRGVGARGEDPVFQVPLGRGLEARVDVDGAAPARIVMAWVRPALLHPVDRAGWKRNHVNAVAMQLVNRRLAAIAALPDRPFAAPQAGRRDARRAAEIFMLSVGYEGGNWQKTIESLTQTLRALRAPFSQTEIDSVVLAQKASWAGREVATRTSPAIATALASDGGVEDINVSPTQARMAADEDLAGLTPAIITAAMNEMFGGDPLIFVSSRAPIAGGEAALLEAYRAQNGPAEETAPPTAQAVKWPYTRFGSSGRVVETSGAPDLGVTALSFSNNVRLLVRPSKLRANQVLVSVKLGYGRLGLPKDRPAAAWILAGLVPSGLGALSSIEMGSALSGKSYGANFAVNDGAFSFIGSTTSRDLETQLQIFAAYLKDPGFRGRDFDRFKQQAVGRLSSANATPAGKMGQQASEIWHNGDKRWATPSPQDVQAATMDDLLQLARPVLNDAPVEVIITGDTTVEDATRLVAATLGALPTRKKYDLAVTPQNNVAFPSGVAETVALKTSVRSAHAMASVAWAARGFFVDLNDDAALRILSAVLRDKLIEAVRGTGLSYLVQVNQSSSSAFDYGTIAASATMPPDKVQLFYDAVDRIVGELRAGKIGADEFQRSLTPTVQSHRRAGQTNDYWLALLANGWDDAPKFNRARTYEDILTKVTREDVAAAARKYLVPERMVRITAGE